MEFGLTEIKMAGREYKHFKSQEELDEYNKVGDTEFGRDTGFVPYQAWTERIYANGFTYTASGAIAKLLCSG